MKHEELMMHVTNEKQYKTPPSPQRENRVKKDIKRNKGYVQWSKTLAKETPNNKLNEKQKTQRTSKRKRKRDQQTNKWV